MMTWYYYIIQGAARKARHRVFFSNRIELSPAVLIPSSPLFLPSLFATIIGSVQLSSTWLIGNLATWFPPPKSPSSAVYNWGLLGSVATWLLVFPLPSATWLLGSPFPTHPLLITQAALPQRLAEFDMAWNTLCLPRRHGGGYKHKCRSFT